MTEKAGQLEHGAQPSFSLLTEPWIRVRRIDGEEAEVGLLQFFAEAEEYKDLNGESATQDFALFRILQAIIIRSFRESPLVLQRLLEAGAEDSYEVIWKTLRNDSLTLMTTPYLKALEDRFDLFHPETPFFQVADLRTEKNEYKGSSELVPDVGSKRLFSTATEAAANDLPPSVAARWLVRLHAYDHSGIKSGALGDPRVKNGKGYGIGTGWLGAAGSVQICGPNLKETLLLNISIPQLLALGDENDTDLAPWERKPDMSHPRSSEALVPRGIVDLLTWQQRRVRLIPRSDGTTVTNVLISNGDQIQVRNQMIDPSCGYRYSKAQSKGGVDVFFPRKHDPDLTIWRGVQGIFQQREAPKDEGYKAAILHLMEDDFSRLFEATYGDSIMNVRLVGVEYGTQDAIVTGEIVDEIPMHVTLLAKRGEPFRRLIIEATETAMRMRGKMTWFYRQLFVCAGGSDEIDPSTQLQAWLYSLEREFVRWISGIGEDTEYESAERVWNSILWRVTSTEIASAVEQAGPRASVGWIETTETGKNIIHSSARYEAWAIRQLREATGLVAEKSSATVTKKTGKEMEGTEL